MHNKQAMVQASGSTQSVGKTGTWGKSSMVECERQVQSTEDEQLLTSGDARVQNDSVKDKTQELCLCMTHACLVMIGPQCPANTSPGIK